LFFRFAAFLLFTFGWIGFSDTLPSESSSPTGKVSQICLNELDYAVPFACAADLARLRCLTVDQGRHQRKGKGKQHETLGSEASILQCLEANLESLRPSCADVTMLARDHYLEYPGHDETSFNVWGPQVKRLCQEAEKSNAVVSQGCKSTFCVQGARD